MPVDGIELSQDMVDRMRDKPDGPAVPVTVGDMSRAGTGRTYGLVYLVFNTIGNLLTQDDQVRCFENAARHLDDDGLFVLECRVPTAPTRAVRQFVEPEDVGLDHVVLGVCRYDPVTQILDINHVRIASDGIVFGPIRLRQANPPEFDLMARIAGLRLRDRWAGWNEEPFTADSWRHVSVYEPPPGAEAPEPPGQLGRGTAPTPWSQRTMPPTTGREHRDGGHERHQPGGAPRCETGHGQQR